MENLFAVFALTAGCTAVIIFALRRVRGGNSMARRLETLPGYIHADREPGTDENQYTPALRGPSSSGPCVSTSGGHSSKDRQISSTMLSLKYKSRDDSGLLVSVRAEGSAESRRKAISELMGHLENQRNVRPPFSLSIQVKEEKTGLSVAEARLDSSECAGLDAVARVELIAGSLSASLEAGRTERLGGYA